MPLRTQPQPIPQLPPEVLSIILSYSGVKERACFLSSNKFMFELALPYAWYELDSYYPVFFLLPSTTKQPKLKRNSVMRHSQPTSVWFKPSHFDKERFLQYTENIKVLTISFNGAAHRFHNWQVLKCLTPLTPKLEQLTFCINFDKKGSTSPLICDMISLCCTSSLKSCTIVTRPRRAMFDPERDFISGVLKTLEKHAPDLEEISWGDVYLLEASLSQPTSDSGLFDGLPRLTRLSMNFRILGELLAPLHYLAQLPHLVRLELHDWIKTSQHHKCFTTREEKSGIWFPQLREIALTLVTTSQAVHLLGTVLPATMGVIELLFEHTEYNSGAITSTLVKHKHSLHTLKLSLEGRTHSEILTIAALGDIFQLKLLRILEVENHKIEYLDPAILSNSWPYIEQLHWPSESFPVSCLRLLAQRCLRLSELHVRLDLSDRSEFISTDLRQESSYDGPIPSEMAADLRHPTSSPYMRLKSNFPLDPLARNDIESLARYLVRCWRHIKLVPWVEQIRYVEGGDSDVEVDDDQSEEKYAWLCHHIEQTQSSAH